MEHNAPDIDPLSNIIFINLPENAGRDLGGFELDPEIPLPVETAAAGDRFDPQELSWEMIISGMLKILAYRGDHEDAEYFRTFVTTLKPDIEAELSQTGVLKAESREIELAEEIFLALCGLFPDSGIHALNLAMLYQQRAEIESEKGDQVSSDRYLDLTYEQYRTVFRSEQTPVEAHWYAAIFYIKNNDFSSARTHLEFYLEAGTDKVKRAEARSFLDEIQRHDLEDTLFKEAFDFIRMGREQEGIERARRFLEKNPSVWNAWFLLAWGLRRLGRYSEARDGFLAAMKHGPGNPDTLNELAICCMELGELEQSEKYLTQALEMEPENTKIIANLGVLALKQDDIETARRYFTSVLEYTPDDPIALKYLAEL